MTFILITETLYQDKLADWIVLWSSNTNESFHTVTELDIKSTDGFHVYKLFISKDTSLVNKVCERLFNADNCITELVYFIITAGNSLTAERHYKLHKFGELCQQHN